MLKTKRMIIGLVLSGLTISTGFTQSFDASSMAMGGAYGAVARGVNALAWNPANLVFPRIHPVELNLVGFNLSVANSSLSLNTYNRYFTESGHNGTWEQKDIDQILNLIPDNGLQASADADINAFGLAFLYYGIHAELIGNSLGVIPKAPAQLALLGNQKEQYRLDDANLESFSAVKIGFSAAHPIPFKKYFDLFSVGIAFNYFRGTTVAEVTRSEGAFYTGRESIDYYFKMDGRMSMEANTSDSSSGLDISGIGGGKGFGFDLGIAGITNKKFQFSLVLKNLFANIKWNNNTNAFSFSSEVDSISLNNMDSINQVSTDTVYSIGGFTTYLPVIMHLGVAYTIKDNWLVSMDLEQAFSDNLGYSDQAKLALGTEYTVAKFLPLRAGVAFGGKLGGYNVGLGFGLHFYVVELDFAYVMHSALWPTYSRGASAAFNLKFLF
jgi:hypothetical protein